MYAALFEMESMFGHHCFIFAGETPVSIMDAFEQEQSLECLIRHGRMAENREGQTVLDRLEEFYNKYVNFDLTMDDIVALDVNLSVGTIKCHTIAEGTKDIAALIEQHPDAIMPHPYR